MASIKVKFRPSTSENKEGTIYYQIIQNRNPSVKDGLPTLYARMG